MHFLVAGQRYDTLPRGFKVEAPVFLAEPHRLVDDALLILVVANLDKASQREILAQRMTLKPVIGQDTAQIGLPGKHDPEQVVALALPPRRRSPQAMHRRHRCRLVGHHNDSNPVVSADREQVVDHVEPKFATWKVHAAQIHHLLACETRIVAQHRHQRQQTIPLGMHDQLASIDGGRLHPRQGSRDLNRKRAYPCSLRRTLSHAELSLCA